MSICGMFFVNAFETFIMKYILLFFGLVFSLTTFGQSNKNDLAVSLSALTVPNFDNYRIGGDVSARYYFTDVFSSGINFYTASPRFKHGFGFDTDQTLINIYSISIPVQYEVINTKKFNLSVGFSSGVLLNLLRNRNDTKEVTVYDPETGIETVVELPKRLKTDTYYTLTPYIEGSLRLFVLDAEQSASLYLTGKFGYQNVFRNGAFSNRNDFTDYLFSLGIMVRGTLD